MAASLAARQNQFPVCDQTVTKKTLSVQCTDASTHQDGHLSGTASPRRLSEISYKHKNPKPMDSAACQGEATAKTPADRKGRQLTGSRQTLQPEVGPNRVAQSTRQPRQVVMDSSPKVCLVRPRDPPADIDLDGAESTPGFTSLSSTATVRTSS